MKVALQHGFTRAQAHRLGGDEFAITCEQGDVSWVESMLKKTVEDMHDSGFEFTDASFGSAHVYEKIDNQKLEHIADCRMYENKRNRKRIRNKDKENQVSLS